MKRARKVTTVTYDFAGILGHLTRTRARHWLPENGPDTRSGIDYYYRHTSGQSAYLNLDQCHLTVSVDAETVYAGDPVGDPTLKCFISEQ